MSAAVLLRPLERLGGLSQGIWLDFPGRASVRSGELARLIAAEEIAGVTPNLGLFERVVTERSEYDLDIAELARRDLHPAAIRAQLSIADAQEVADVLRPVFDATEGRDGFASVTVSPHAAHDADEMIELARGLWSMLARPNGMITIPATVAGVAAIRELTAEGINVHVAQVYGLTRYRHVALAYVEGLRLRERSALPITHVASVVSYMLGPIDRLLNPRLEAMAALGSTKAASLVNQVAISSAKVASQRWCDVFEGDSFAKLAQMGARPQKMLWTGAESDGNDGARHVDALMGNGTATTMTFDAITKYRNHGRPVLRLNEGVQEAQAALANLASLGVDLGAVALQLECEALRKVTAEFDSLLTSIARKRGQEDRYEVASLGTARQSYSCGAP